MLIGAEFDSQPSFSRMSSFDALRSYAYKITMLLPFLRVDAHPADLGGALRHLGRLEPDHGRDRRRRLPGHTGWGTWGFKAIPAGGEAMAELIATGRPSDLIAPFSLERFRRDHVAGRPGLGRDALMHTLDCPRCGRRPLDEFVFGGERRPTPSTIEDPDARDFDEVWIFDNPDGDDDRTVVPRGRLPALADDPARHLGRPRARGLG